MQVRVAIGANLHFELREALLVYRDNHTSFITRHEATVRKDAPPALGPAQPLTVAFVESLVRSLGGSVAAEVLPESILSKGDRMVVRWTPARRRQMFYENSEGKAADLNGRTFPQPPLVWRVANGELSIRALTENKRPEAATKLAVAPFGTFRLTVLSVPVRCDGPTAPPWQPYRNGSAAFTRAPSHMPTLAG